MRPARLGTRERTTSEGTRRPERVARDAFAASSPKAEILAAQRAAGNRAVSRLLQPSAANHPPPFPVQAGELTRILGAGKRLPGDMQESLQAHAGGDLSHVQIHDDALGHHVAASLGADAVSVDEHIAFRRGRYDPTSPGGRALLAHEAGHIAAGSALGGTTGTHPVQLKVSVDDVSQEMVGLQFTLRTAQGTPPNQIPQGATVTVTDWKGKGNTATVEYAAGGSKISVEAPKLALEPATPSATGVRRYRAGVSAQQTAVEKAQADVEQQTRTVGAWKAQESKYQKNRKVWEQSLRTLEEELLRRTTTLRRKEEVLSQTLVQQTMYNRFDPVIAQWVDYYNKTLKPHTDLDPNIVKSMLFQESRMGTSGEHLELPPYLWTDPIKNPIRSRFNIGQAIDSFPHQQLLMIKEMAPTIYNKYKLAELEKENATKGKTNQEFMAWRGGDFGKAMVESHQKDPTTKTNLMRTPDRELYEDYSFWIRTAVRWLFFKYFSLPKPGWPEAVRAYNGSGPGAQKYRKEVMRRVGSTSDVDVSGR